MKTNRIFLPVGIIALLVIFSCQRNLNRDLFPDQPAGAKKTTPSGTCNPNAYTITLESKTFTGPNWEWVWSVQNPNPGNGNNGTSQDLSHWGMQFGTCFVWASVAGAAYSYDGINWNSISPSYEVDPSQGCVTTPVLKFDQGTSGSAKTYYKLILSQDYLVGASFGYYKSGSRTGCCTFNFNGVSCDTGTGEDPGK